MFFENKWGYRLLIISEPIGGLNDRLKFLVSCMRIDENIKLIWPYKTHEVWLQCSFEDLFINNFEVFNNKEECYSKYDGVKYYSGSQFMKVDRDDITVNGFSMNNWGNSVPKKQKSSILKQINNLKPSRYIQDIVDKFKSKFDDNVVTVSIRSFLDAKRNIGSNGKYFDIETIFSAMDNELYNEKTFYVTCDHQETFEKIFDRYKDRILYTPKRTYFGDYKTVEGTQDCVIDLILGGQPKHILSTNGSGFCEMQWWFGGGNSTIEIMRAHSNL